MVKKEQSKRQKSIRSKLMAAVCMLLVSAIMMVSSTYAWFTLSTAPEVTGITTSVGANGNLEMLLQPLNGASEDVVSSTQDGTAATDTRNRTWGNLVDLRDNTIYGLNLITLYPSQLNTQTGTSGEGFALAANPLSTPEYGADGRISGLASSTISGVYQNNAFNEDYQGNDGPIKNAKGVRAVGIASGMSERQLAYRAAMSNASSADSQAKRVASNSLNNNGATLADVAITHALADTGTDRYDDDDVAAMLAIVNGLLGYDTDTGETTTHTTGALEYIEDALMQYILANSIAEATDDGYAAIKTAIEGATLADVTTVPGVVLPAGFGGENGYIAKLNKAIDSAKAALDELKKLSGNSYTWDQISPAMSGLVNTAHLDINGMSVSDVMKNPGDVAKSIMKNGLVLTMKSGAGVYADIADFCGDYSASIIIPKLSYGTLEVSDVEATMTTKTDVGTVYLSAASDAVEDFTASAGGSSSKPISDFYGYIIDLAFRTNAADSYLQLQAEAIDRIYDDGSNPATMGHGANMSFTSGSDTFTSSAVKGLMAAIRVVFFDTDTGNIIGYARLDDTTAQTDTTGKVTMNLVMTDANGDVTKDEDGVVDGKTIMALEPNAVHELSVLVYLDGTVVTNANVATDAAKSMIGTMNLQFSSSANLVPMEYTDLKTGTGDTDSNTPAVTPITNASATGVDGVTVNAVTDGTNVAFALGGTFDADTHEIVKVSVDSNDYTSVTSGSLGSVNGYVVAASNVTADSVVVVTVREKTAEP